MVKQEQAPTEDAEAVNRQEVATQFKHAQAALKDAKEKADTALINKALDDVSFAAARAFNNGYFDIAKEATLLIPLGQKNQDGGSVFIEHLDTLFTNFKNRVYPDIGQLSQERARDLERRPHAAQSVRRKFQRIANDLLTKQHIAFLLWCVERLADPDALQDIKNPIVWQENLILLAEACAMVGADDEIIFRVFDVLEKIPKTGGLLRIRRSEAVARVALVRSGLAEEGNGSYALTSENRLSFAVENEPLTGADPAGALALLQNHRYVAYRDGKVIDRSIARALYGVIINNYYRSLIGEGIFDSSDMRKVYDSIVDLLQEQEKRNFLGAIEQVAATETSLKRAA